MPSVLPIFPLTGSLLLPGNWLPLHIFEPRYRNMIEDAMKGDPLIGMIQPLAPQQDNQAPAPHEEETPELYEIGCAGRIEECEPTPDGRYLIALVGLTRFRVRDELPLDRGYRRARVAYEEFEADLRKLPQTEVSEELVEALCQFADRHNLSFDLERLRELPAHALVNGLAMALPFAPAENKPY